MKSQYYWRYKFNFELFNYLTNYSASYGNLRFPPRFIFNVKTISLEIPNHFAKNIPVLHISGKKKKIIWAVLFKNDPSNHQVVLSPKITEHRKVPRWSSSLLPGAVLGALSMVWGQISLKRNKRYSSVPACHCVWQQQPGYKQCLVQAGDRKSVV